MPPKTRNQKEKSTEEEAVSDNIRSKETEHDEDGSDSSGSDGEDEDLNFNPFMNRPDKNFITQVFSSLNKLHDKFDKLNEDIHGSTNGLESRVSHIEEENGENNHRIELLEEHNALLRKELEIAKGIIQRQAHYQQVLENRLEEQVARSMSPNITISGIEHSENENCADKVHTFFTDVMKITGFEKTQILTAHRMGDKFATNPTMVAKLDNNLKGKVFENVSNLKDKKNSRGKYYYVNQQRPESLDCKYRIIREKIKELKTSNEGKPKDQQTKFFQKKDKLFINGKLFVKEVRAPEPLELFPTQEEQRKMNNMDIQYTDDSYGDLGSKFWGAGVKVSNVAEVRRAYRKIRQDNPAEDKIMMGYIIKHGEKVFKGYEDDHEHSGGYKVFQCLSNKDVSNLAVFILRRYGGQHLHKKRFDYIDQVTNEVIQMFQ